MRSAVKYKALGAVLIAVFGVCSFHYIFWSKDVVTIYVITPTFYRITQKPELVRLCTAFSHIPNLHWIVVEDSANKTE